MQWTQTWDNVSLSDAGGTISFDPLTTRVIVTGFTQTTASNWEYMALTYAVSNGTLAGSSVTTLGGTSIDRVSDATADASGNMYITGALGTVGEGLNIKTVKLDASLNILWTATWNGAANLDDAASSIVVDASGNVYVAGYTTNASNTDAILIKYNSSGTASWTEIHDGGGSDAFADIALNGVGEIFAGGHSATADGTKDFYVSLYNSSGTEIWSEAYNGLPNRDEEIRYVKSDGNGNFLVNGPSKQWNGSDQLLTVKYAHHARLIPQDEEVNAPFVENRGQVLNTSDLPEDDIRYYSRSNYPNLYIFDDQVSFVFFHIDTVPSSEDTTTRVDLIFKNSRGNAAAGLERQADFHNYYLGHIPEGREQVMLENKVIHPDIYSDIDALYGQGQDGFFIRFICKPGSDPSDIKMGFKGATGLSILPDGSLKVETLLESLILRAPTAVLSSSGGVETSAAWIPAFVINVDNSVSVTTGSVTSGSSLILKSGRGRDDTDYIDSWWSTYYGWTSTDMEAAVECDDEANVYTCGRSWSTNFPIGPFILSANGQSDWTINKFNYVGVPLWFTMIGGAGLNNGDFRERARDISVAHDPDPFLYVSGDAVQWPEELFKNPNNGFHDITFNSDINLIRGAIAKIEKINGKLNWASYFSDKGLLRGAVMGVKSLNNGSMAAVGFSSEGIHVSEWTNVNPGSGAFQQGFGDMFIGTFNSSNQLIWATKFGPLNIDIDVANAPTDITVDGDDNLFVTGVIAADATPNDNFPTGGGLAFTASGLTDGFVAKFSPNRALTWSTYIGGSNQDYCSGIACDPTTNNIVVLGTTESSVGQGFPILGSGDPLRDDGTLDGRDLFLVKFSNTGTMLHSRYFGGEGNESTDLFTLGDNIGVLHPSNGIATSPEGNVFITGTATAGLPANWFFTNPSGLDDAFMAAFSSGFKKEYCTYLGSSRHDNGTGIAVTNAGSIGRHTMFMVGRTNMPSSNYPTSKETMLSYHSATQLGGNYDGIITKLKTPSIITVDTKEKILPLTSIKTSPNPCTDFLSINISESFSDEIGMVEIFDLSGRNIESFKILGGQNLILLDTRRFPKGTYMLNVSLVSGKWSGKFIKS